LTGLDITLAISRKITMPTGPKPKGELQKRRK
jgi:hypothetical protein